MARERKIIVHIATSADGFIARPDGSVDWLDRPRVAGDYGMGAFMRSVDTILWGRKTYDMALKMGGVGGCGANIKNYVFTHRPPPAPAILPSSPSPPRRSLGPRSSSVPRPV